MTNLDYGTNGFYLPMDGNSPIGEDKSEKGMTLHHKGLVVQYTLITQMYLVQDLF